MTIGRKLLSFAALLMVGLVLTVGRPAAARDFGLGEPREAEAEASSGLVREALHGACARDARRLCKKVQRVGIRILGCLASRARDLSPACHAALRRAGVALDRLEDRGALSDHNVADAALLAGPRLQAP